MFDIFKKDVKVGDKVKLYLTTGKEPVGIVTEIGDNFVLLKESDLISNRFFDKLIGGWDLIAHVSAAIKYPEITQKVSQESLENHTIDIKFILDKIELLLTTLKKDILDSSVKPNGAIIARLNENFIASNSLYSDIPIPRDKIVDEALLEALAAFRNDSSIPVVLSIRNRKFGKPVIISVALPQTIRSFLTKFATLVGKMKLTEAYAMLDIFKFLMGGFHQPIADVIRELKKVKTPRNAKRAPVPGPSADQYRGYKNFEREINELIQNSYFERAINKIETELEKQTGDAKYRSNLLLKKAQIFSSLNRPGDSEKAYQELITFNEKNNFPANNLSHLYTELARLQSLNRDKLNDAISTIKKALSYNPSNTFAHNLLKRIEREVGSKESLPSHQAEIEDNQLVIDATDESNTISKLIDADIKEHKFTHPQILINGGKPTSYIAKRILDEARKTRDVDLSERYPIYLEAAKAFSELNVGSYDLLDYQEAAAYYSLLKGNSLYIAFRKLVLTHELEVTKLTRLKDSSSSYFFEALNLLSNIDPQSLLVVLANYLRLNVVVNHLKHADTVDYSLLFKMQFSDIFSYCISSKNEKIEEIAFKAVLEFGSSSINAWNKLSRLTKGTGQLYSEFSQEQRRKRIYQIINRFNTESFSEDIYPSEFLKNCFQLRAKQKNAFNSSFTEISTLEFSPINFRTILKAWEDMFSNNRFLSDTDIEVETDIRNLISIIQPYLNRKQIERTNILIQANSIIQKRLKFIKENTTYYGRTLFYELLVKWGTEINELLKEKIAQSFPSLSILIDPPYYITTNEQKIIPIVIKNEGEATSEGFVLKVSIESTIFATKEDTTIESTAEIPAGNQLETNIPIPDYLLDESNAVELTINVQAIYQAKKLPIKKCQFTIEKEPAGSLSYDDIPWRDGPIPSKDLFKGRKQLVSDLAQHYLSIERDKPFILYGLTRTGKSSVLEYLKKNIEGDTFYSKGSTYKIITFSWELNEAASQANASDFYYYILYQQTFEILERYGIQQNLDISELKIDEKKVRFRDFKIILDFLAKNRLYPLFLIDEFSFIKNLIDKTTIDSSFLHSLRQFALNGLASFVFAGTYDIKELIKNPRYGITGQLVNSIEYQVNEIGDDAAEELIEVINEKLSFTPEAIEHIKFLSGNIPYFIQIICKHCGNYAVENSRRYIGYPELEKVIRILIGQDQSQPTSLVKKLSEGTFQNNQFSPADPKEVSVLISSIVHFNKNELVPRGIGAHELEKMWADKKLGSYKQKLAESINLLMEKKILAQEEDEGLPVYKLSVDLFRRWWAIHHPDINLILMTLKED